MKISPEMQKIIAAKFNQAKSVNAFKKEMTKMRPMEKLTKSMKHKKMMLMMKGK